MKTEASLLQAIASAGTLREQIVLTQELDALRAQSASRVQAERDLDLGNAVVEQTLRPVRVHEMHTASTDWLDEVTTSPIDKTAATQGVLAEAALWFGRTAAEVKADHDEFAEQARGQARRVAGAYGDQAPEMEAAYLEYVSFLHRREAASGLDQIQQTVDPHDNPKATPLPEDTFDTFEDPVAPENVGVDEQQSSYNAPLLQEIMSTSDGNGAGAQPSQHGAGGTSQPPGGGSGMQVGASLADVPSVAINHVMTLDQFIATERAQKAASRNQPEPPPFDEGAVAPASGGTKTATKDDGLVDGRLQLPALQIRHRSSSRGSGYDVDHVVSPSYVATLSRHATPEEAMGAAVMHAHQNGVQHVYHPGGYVRVSTGKQAKRTVVARFEREAAGPSQACRSCGLVFSVAGGRSKVDTTKCAECAPASSQKAAASGLDQVQQVVNPHEDPAPTPLPEEVAFPLNDGEDEGDATPRPSQHNSASRKQAESGCACAKHGDGSVTTMLCPKHATEDPCATMAAVTGERRKGSVKSGTCTNCGWSANKTASLQTQADMYGAGDSPHGVPGAGVANTPADYPQPSNGSFEQGKADGARDAVDPEQRPTYSDASSHTTPYVQGYVEGYQGTPVPQAVRDVPPSVSQDRTKGNDAAMMAAAAGLVSTATLHSRDFKKGYRYASRWSPTKRIVRRGSVEFESGLYAGMLVNTASNQVAWAKAHAKWGEKDGFFTQRMAQHRQFTALRAQAASEALPAEVKQCIAGGTHLNDVDDDGYCNHCGHQEGWDYERQRMREARKQAGTSTDLETMDPGVDADPGGNTPLNGPGTPPPLAGGMDPAAPGGAAPYNGAAPYSSPVAPDPEWVDPSKMSPQAVAFRKNVQAALLAQANGEAKVPVCRGCGEAFENRQIATEAHGKNGCGTETGERGYEMRRESEAW